MLNLAIKVAIAAPTTPKAGKVRLPYIKIQLNKILIPRPITVMIIAGLVTDKPSLNCLSARKSINGIVEIAMMCRYLLANTVTSAGWPKSSKFSAKKKRITQRIALMIKLSSIPVLSISPHSLLLSAPLAIAIMGAMAAIIPIPITTKKKYTGKNKVYLGKKVSLKKKCLGKKVSRKKVSRKKSFSEKKCLGCTKKSVSV